MANIRYFSKISKKKEQELRKMSIKIPQKHFKAIRNKLH